MTETLISQPESGDTSVPIKFAGSPYLFKTDPYSSHSVILDLLGAGNNRRVLDVGAAHGYLAAVLRNRGFRVTGIEADRALAEEAAKYCETCFRANLDDPLPDLVHQFNAVVFGDVLEHLKDPLDLLRKIAGQYLAKDGIVIISLPNVANFYVRLKLLAGQFDYAERGILDRTHLRFFTRRTFCEMLDEAGLEIVQLTATPLPLPLIVNKRYQGRLFKLVHAFSAWISRHWQTMFGYQFVALARPRRGR
jgi:SAM-dependent methyltransferase